MRAFSLVETILAVSLFLTASLLMAHLLPSSWLAQKSAEQRLLAGQLAQSALEHERSLPVESLASSPLAPVVRDGVEYRGDVEVQPVAGRPRLRKVVATVRWSTRRGEQKVERGTVFCGVPL